MKLPRLRYLLLLAPVIAFAAFYVTGMVVVAGHKEPIAVLDTAPAGHETIVIFGASGTAGDGILEAALADPVVETIHVITRRETPRIKEGVETGKVVMTIHMDYLDYAAVHEQIAAADAVFWAIGISALKVDEETYGRIHVDFPVRFATEWLAVSTKPNVTLHYISSSDISEDSSAHWAREKVRAENALFGLADGTRLKVIAYRPDYIGPTDAEANFGQDLLYGFFVPVGAAVKATDIGQTMLEATARGDEFDNGDKIGTLGIIRYADAYRRRVFGAADGE